MSFKIEDDFVYLKHNEIWNEMSGIKLSSDIIYDNQFNTFKMVKNLFDNGTVPEEKIEYERIPCISVDSVIKIEK